MIEDLLLDPQLKWWMLLPISIAMVLVGLLRSNVTYLLSLKPKIEFFKNAREKYVHIHTINNMTVTNNCRSFLQRASAYKENNQILSSEEMEIRRAYFVENLSGTSFYAKIEDPSTPLNPFTDASTNDALMNMAKGNLMGYVPQTLIMGWVNYFFAGSVVMKLPFPLTEGFKSMLQNGVNTPNLNARYVSAISWYFVNLFGLRPVYSLIMDDPAAAEELINLQQQQGFAGLGAPGGPKADKVFKAEAENIQILEHKSAYTNIASRVLERYENA